MQLPLTRLRPLAADSGRTRLTPLTALQAKKWAQLSKKKWSVKQKHGFSEAQKEELAPEVVRKIIKVRVKG